MNWSRRRFLAASLSGAIALCPSGGRAQGTVPAGADVLRVATTSWLLAEAMLSMGRVPVAMADTRNYRLNLPDPPLPEDVVNLGAVWEPNRELMASLSPDLILLPSEHRVNEGLLSRIAPTDRMPEPPSGLDRLAQVIWTWRWVGERLALMAAAEGALEDGFLALDRARDRLAGSDDRTLYLVDLDQGGQRVDVFGAPSLFHGVLTALGLGTAWSGPMEAYGWVSTGIEWLSHPDARIVYLDRGPSTQRSLARLRESTLWRSLPAVRAGRCLSIPSVFVWGGLSSAVRLADALADRLSQGQGEDQGGGAEHG